IRPGAALREPGRGIPDRSHPAPGPVLQSLSERDRRPLMRIAGPKGFTMVELLVALCLLTLALWFTHALLARCAARMDSSTDASAAVRSALIATERLRA